MEKVFLGLGSNKGDPEKTLRAAFAALGRILSDARISSFYRSSARYVETQPDFTNAVASGWTDLAPLDLLASINAIEAHFGRDRSAEIPKGPRPLDIDILLFGRRIIAEPQLVVPHPGLRERKFVLLPLLELDPELADPVSGQGIGSILSSLPPQGIYLLQTSDYDALYL